MVRKRNCPRREGPLINVAIYPEIHKVISHMAIDEGNSIRKQVNLLLCEKLDRMDLWEKVPEAVAS